MMTTARFNRTCTALAKRLGTGYAAGYPSALMIEPTNHCNLACVLCPTGAGWLAHPQGYMEVDALTRLLDEASPYVNRVAFWNWGEPFLHHRLLDMIRYARRLPAWLQVATNGHFFTDPSFAEEVVASGINQLIVALDGANAESVARYRGPHASFDRVVTGIRNLTATRDRLGHGPSIEVQFLVMQHNQHEIEDVRRLAADLGADRFYCKTLNMRWQDLPNYASWLPDEDVYRRFESRVGGSLTVKGTPSGICPYVYDTAVVLWDGSLVPCCFDGEERYVLGNAFRDGLWRAWNGAPYRTFRRMVRWRRTALPMCAWCPEARSQQRTSLGRFWTEIQARRLGDR